MTTTTTEQLRLVLADLDADVEYNAPIGETMTWYSIGGKADVLVRPHSTDALITLMQRCRESHIPVRLLGSGANLLVHDEGVDGIVIHLNHSAFREVSAIHRHRHNRGGDGQPGDGIRVMAGASMERLVMNQSLQGMAGLEMMAGIPASVGGAIRMNAGGKFGAISDVVISVGCVDLDGNAIIYPADAIEFGYRRCSIIDPVILWAEFRLQPMDPKRVHGRVKEIFAYKKKVQPMGAKSAGCAFKNPIAHDGTADPKRISAGQLIDRAGLKNYSVGGAHISEQHANFIAAEKTACAQDVIDIMEHVQRVVRDQAGYELQREIIIWKRKSPSSSSSLNAENHCESE